MMDAFDKNIGIFNIVVSSTPSNMKIKTETRNIKKSSHILRQILERFNEIKLLPEQHYSFIILLIKKIAINMSKHCVSTITLNNAENYRDLFKIKCFFVR